MILAKLFTKIFKEGGIILIDSENQKYICGSPRQINPITLKLLKKDLKSKKHPITAMTIETTILDFQLSNTFEQYESHMNAEE